MITVDPFQHKHPISSNPIPSHPIRASILTTPNHGALEEAEAPQNFPAIDWSPPHPAPLRPIRHNQSRPHETHFNVAKTTVLTKIPFFFSCQNRGFVVIWSSGLSRFLHHACHSSFAVSYNIFPAPAVRGSNGI